MATSTTAFAAEAEGAEPHPYFSTSALERMAFGLNAKMGFGTGSFLSTSTGAFYKPIDSAVSDDAPDLFGSGFRFELEGGLALGPAVTLGLAGAWQSLSTVDALGLGSTSVVLNSNSSHGASAWFGFVRAQGQATVAPFFDFGLGAGRFHSKLQGEAQYQGLKAGNVEQELNISAFVWRMKAGLDVAPISTLPNVSFGASLGGEAWIPVSRCISFPGQPEDCDTTDFSARPNLGWSATLGARFVLPVTKEPLPPPPPVREYVLVESELHIATTEGVLPEVTDTPRYRAELPNVRTVALQAPSECVSQTAANATGQAAATGTVVKTYCGVEMGELERALTKQGFVVQSWSTLASMVQEHRITPAQAAGKLGAQVLFQVNSLERVQGEPARGARWERRFYKSDDQAAQGEPMELPENERQVLRAMVSQREDRVLTGTRLGAMLDVNAILVSTGQTIWFYRWQKLDTGDMTTSLKALATRLPPSTWERIQPRRASNASTASDIEARTWVEREEEKSGGAPENARDALYFQLMRDVVRDFVTRFTNGAGAGPAQP